MTDRPVYGLCDWGTSSFRLWLVDADGIVLGERRSNDGLAASAEQGFAKVLEAHLLALDAPGDIPVVVCGMAGSKQGWVEVPYVDLPAGLDNLAQGSIQVPDLQREVHIIPGMVQRAPADVMRGEETQMLGVLAQTGLSDGHLVMPGTHSKWVLLHQGTAIRFRTFLTGELYALLSEHSILRHSLGMPRAVARSESSAFKRGVRAALEKPALLGHLFSVRAATLVSDQSPEDAASFLSGLLIGAEIADAMESDVGRVVLLASNAIATLYGVALSLAGVEHELADADAAAREGLLMIARRLYSET